MATAPAGPRTDLKMDHFRRLLEKERENLTTQLRKLDEQDESMSVSEEAGNLAHYDQHPADDGTETYFREADEAIERGMQAELNAVESSLHRLEEGTYGYCARCGAEIPKARLEALPSALFCVQCASEV